MLALRVQNAVDLLPVEPLQAPCAVGELVRRLSPLQCYSRALLNIKLGTLAGALVLLAEGTTGLIGQRDEIVPDLLFGALVHERQKYLVCNSADRGSL